jgi:predicted transcriptional regulator
MRAKEFMPEESLIEITTEELESINRGLKDIDEGNIHSHETARKIYEKYLSNVEST